MRIAAFLAAGSFVLATPVLAQSVGLIIANQDYDAMADVSRGTRPLNAARDFESAGMQVVQAEDADYEDMQRALGEFAQMAGQSETLMVALSGQFVYSETETYFMPIDAEAGPLATLPATSLPLSTVMAYLAARPGHAVLLLATDAAETGIGPYLTGNIGDLDIPQGVTVLRGSPQDIASFMRGNLSKPGREFVPTARRARDVQVEGFAPDDLVLLPEPEPESAPTPAPQPQASVSDRVADIRAWRSASDANTVEAYESYLKAFPGGEFVRMAENRIQSLTDTPEARAEREEQALDLDRDQRREIQRDLSLLDFNTRGIDGIFGRGTRAAIADWQKSQGFPGTGFLNRDQITRLDAQAERRALELEAEAEQRRQDQLRVDLAYWDETGAKGDEAGLRAYLNRFPDGEYSEVAREQLATIERDKRRETDARDRQLWDEATQVNSIQAYRDYLQLSPGGAFRDEAQSRIAALQQIQSNSAAAREEQALNLSPRTIRIIESRLESLGLRPGNVDGVLDEDSRRAIRRYQAARNMPETGYLNEPVVVQLLADSVRQIFR